MKTVELTAQDWDIILGFLDSNTDKFENWCVKVGAGKAYSEQLVTEIAQQLNENKND